MPHAHGISFGLTLPIWPLEDAFWTARYADRHGFGMVSYIDHLAGPESPSMPEALTTLTAIAATTKKVRVMSGVSDPHRRPPALMAQTAATIDIVSAGRFTLGLGAGEAMNLSPFGIGWSKPVSKLREFIIVLKKLWSGEPVTYESSFFTLKHAAIRLETVQKPHPPIWIGGLKRRMLELTGELGDGWYPTPMPPEQYRERLQTVRDAAEKAERDPDTIVPAVELFIAVSRERSVAEENVAPATKAFLCLFPELLESLGYRGLAREEFALSRFTRTPETMAALEKASSTIPIEAVQRVCPYGTPDECIEFLEELVKAGARYFIIFPAGDMRFVKTSSLPLLVEKVIAYFKTKA